MSKKTKINLAREFRKNPTKAEKQMWQALRNRCFLNLKFRRQHLLEGYLLDFYCQELKLAVEIDGAIHRSQREEDIKRQKAIEQSGIRFYRIKNEQVERNINKVLEDLANFVNALTPDPSPTKAGEGKIVE